MSNLNAKKPGVDRAVRVLVVDDSAYMRKVLQQILTHSPFIQVVGTACNGKAALELVEQLHPDVITLDLIMPEMNGVDFLNDQMVTQPIPTIIVSVTDESTTLAVAALEAGAIDFVQKPTALATEKLFEMREELIGKIKTAAAVSMSKLPNLTPTQAIAPLPAHPPTHDVIAIGLSTGGPQALSWLIPQLPANFPVPIVIVLPMAVGYTAHYAKRLNSISPLQVREAQAGDELLSGQVILAPAGQHLTLVRQSDGRVVTHLDIRPLDTLHRPAVDVLFQSVAEVFGDRALGIVMTGMGQDGKQGAAWIKAQGGLILAEATETCVVDEMPRSVIEAGLSDRIVPLHQMVSTLLEVL